ncbi:hypothetical protein HanRHA438_Chr08g0327521 [Helianthus annuus]|nr:hypothetical protein HanRHA438_Chr08g0327521 [Helianthus annuus]
MIYIEREWWSCTSDDGGGDVTGGGGGGLRRWLSGCLYQRERDRLYCTTVVCIYMLFFRFIY